jgi:hypothetical protein
VSASTKRQRCFGVLGQFETGEALLEAIERGKLGGFTRMEAYTPFPMHAVNEALGHKNDLPKYVLAGGVLGAVVGFGLQYYASVVHYPMNVGGRPLNSWPSFIPVTFELTILFAALTAVLGIPEFETASRDHFFLLVPHYDPRFDPDLALEILRGTEALTVQEVPHP